MKFTKEVKIALVAIMGIVVFFLGMNFLKGLPLFSTDTTYYIDFDNISGVGASTPIYADGYKVGVVKEVVFDYNRKAKTKLLIDIDPKLRIPLGSTAELASDMLGNVQVNLLLANNPRQKVEPGQTIHGDLASGLMSKVETLMPVIQQMLPKLDSILANVNKITANPDIARSLSNIQTTTANLTVSTAELNRLMAELNHDVPGMVKKANGVLDNTGKFTNNLASLDVQGTLNKVNQTLDNVHELTAKLNSNNGTIGLLMNDPNLYNNMNNTMRNADSLVVDLKSHPKRYVHFSLFGRKDK
nr:MCE family protein [Prevotella sp.]